MLGTNLRLINTICDMGLIVLFRHKSPPPWHKLHILEIPLLPFELEITIDSNIQRVEESKTKMIIIQNLNHL